MRDGPVQRSRVEMAEAERLGHGARRARLARRSRSVDRDDPAPHHRLRTLMLASVSRKRGKAHVGTAHVVDGDARARHRAQHGERHRQPVIARRAHLPCRRARRSGDMEVVALHLRHGTDRAKILRHESQPVALLHPEFTDIAKDRGPLRPRREDGEQGNLVDEAGNLPRHHLGGPERRRCHHEITHRFAELGDRRLDPRRRPHPLQHREEAGSRRVDPHR